MITINQKPIGEEYPTYIIAECSVNHQGDIEIAKKLIDAAADAKVDAVKFQKRNLPSLYPQDILDNPTKYEQSFQYIIPILKETELSFSDHMALKKYAENRNLEYLCTPFDIESAEFLNDIGVDAFKVASCDLTNYELLSFLFDTEKPLIVSTGMSSWQEIQRTVAFLREYCAEYALLHCRSSYPVYPREVNLKMINKLKQFGVPVGYSGHDIGTTIPLIAASMGASVIEKHITLDKKLPGPDHKISLEPHELKILVRDIRVADQAMSTSNRYLLRGEIINRDVFRYKGNYGKTKDLEVPDFGHNRWGLIYRPPDFKKALGLTVEGGVIEFHLTESDLDTSPHLQGFVSRELIVHAPEYCGDKVVDLCCHNQSIRRMSVELVQKTIDWTRRIASYFKGTPKVIVHPGAMSLKKDMEPHVMEFNLLASLGAIDDSGVELLLENLPPYPWYFGGQWKGNYFMDSKEIRNFCDATKYGLCFDISHAALYCNARESDLADYIETVRPHIRHIHLADAYGLDGEGVQIGEGDIDFKRMLPLLPETTWVPEIWRGHLNNCHGFLVALSRLHRLQSNSS